MQKYKKKNIHQRKQSHNTIFMWFGNLPTSTKLQGFHYSQEKKNTKYGNTVFFFFFLYTEFTMSYQTSQKKISRGQPIISTPWTKPQKIFY